MDILDETTEFIDRREGQRPVFLTVLCILTWVGCGFALISGLIQLWSYSAMNSAMNALQTNGVSQDFNVGYLFWSAIATMIGSIICALAAVFMFKQKKFGFYIYIIGQAIPLIVSFYSILAFSNRIGIGTGFSIISTVIGMLFPVAFIIMYGVNLKHMNK